jgi:hypothetical protein
MPSLDPVGRARASLRWDRNRVPTRPGRPLLLDSTGTDFAMSHGRDPLTGANRFSKLVALWYNAVRQAQYIWFSRNANLQIPVDPGSEGILPGKVHPDTWHPGQWRPVPA